MLLLEGGEASEATFLLSMTLLDAAIDDGDAAIGDAGDSVGRLSFLGNNG